MKKAIVSVTNDLVSDQRVDKVCTSLHKMGYDLLLVGRKLPDSLAINRKYETYRMFLLFKTGPLFYAAFNFRLFLFLLFKKADVLVSNDLDTLLPNYMIAKLKGTKLVYDTHEYFTEVPELQHNPFKKRIWKSIENAIFPKLKNVFTVNDSIAQLYAKEYNVKVNVVRNVPRLNTSTIKQFSKVELGLPADKKIIILQGAGINIDRGAEEALAAMEWVNDAILLIIGNGDVVASLKEKAQTEKLKSKIIFKPKMLYAELMGYTRLADIGLTLDKDSNINYRYSLPNKLFDYMSAGIAVLASPLVEVKRIVTEYQVGETITSHKPQHIAVQLNNMLANENQLNLYKQNSLNAAEVLCWENEEKVLLEVYTALQ